MVTTRLTPNISEMIASHKDPKWWTGLLNPEEFDQYEKFAWMQQNWTFSFYASAIYILVIFGLREWMKGRKAFDLKGPLICWNLALAIFSIKGASVGIMEMYKVLTIHGAHLSMCGTVDDLSEDATYWMFLFGLSKVVEFGDTVFIVLRKRKLIFLHWYHHISVFMGAWYSAQALASPSAWACVVNYTVHAFMYTYFTLTAMGIKIPKKVAMAITSTQLTQFAFMLGVMVYAVYAKYWGLGCHLTGMNIFWAFFTGISYLVLFGTFFYNSYLSKDKRQKME